MGIRWRAWHGTPPRFAPERIDSFSPEAGERAAHARAPVLHLQFTARYTRRFFREFNSLNKWQRRTREPKGTPASALQTRRRRHSQSTHRRRWTATVSSLGACPGRTVARAPVTRPRLPLRPRKSSPPRNRPVALALASPPHSPTRGRRSHELSAKNARRRLPQRLPPG